VDLVGVVLLSLFWEGAMQGSVRRLLFVHQNCLFRQLLVQAFSRSDDFEAIDVDHVRPDHRQLVVSAKPQMVLLDLGLPQRQAVELTWFVREHLEACKIVLLVHGAKLTEHSEAAVLECIEAGADGFVLEESPLEELRTAIEVVLAGQRFYSQPIVERMLDQLALFSRESRWKSQLRNVALTKRELEVLRWIAEGLSNKQVARKLSVSLYTVKNHVHNILEKLQVSDRFRAVEQAIDNRWLRSGTQLDSPFNSTGRDVPASSVGTSGDKPATSASRDRAALRARQRIL
jgi:two-component system NarL family response regulator